MAKQKRDIKQEVTDTIVAALKTGVAPWVKSWSGGASNGMPVNGATGRLYNGINVILLWAAAQANGYTSNEWMTFKQAKGLGGSVRKGEKATLVTFWKILKKEDADGNEKKIFFLRHFNVFNRDQIDGLPGVEEVAEPTPAERHERADALIDATGATVTYGSSMAAYSKVTDEIQMPAIEQFDAEEEFYSTSFHELSHWTGAKSRLDRDLSGRFGDESYAMEELVAELSAAFVCAEIGVEGKLQHAEYIGSWIKKLESDKNAIFTAASAARKASDFLLAFEGEEGVEVLGKAA